MTKKWESTDLFRCFKAPLYEGLSVHPLVRPLVCGSVTPSLSRRKKVFHSILCRVSGLVQPSASNPNGSQYWPHGANEHIDTAKNKKALHTDGWMDGKTDRHTDRQTER